MFGLRFFDASAITAPGMLSKDAPAIDAAAPLAVSLMNSLRVSLDLSSIKYAHSFEFRIQQVSAKTLFRRAQAMFLASEPSNV
jgi:hypothetical protein